MAPYNKRGRWRRRRRWRRKRGPYRRIRYPRRHKKKTRARRVGRRLRRHQATIRAWEPDSKVKCNIKGAMFGIIAMTANTTNRLYYTYVTKQVARLWPEGGGVNLRVFSLDFLYSEHRFFRNCWSRTNDGYDLALYLGTKIYLPPHDRYDYLFWWDTDLEYITEPDFYRLHPMLSLCQQHVIYVRNQVKAQNTRTKKVFIKPPAQMTNQWQFASQIYEQPLFAWGVTFINWEEPFYREQTGFLPIIDLPSNSIYVLKGVTWTPLTTGGSGGTEWEKTLAYSPLVDKGVGNQIKIAFIGGSAGKPTNEDGRLVTHTVDLPYWLTCWGQNTSYNFGLTPKMNPGPDTGQTPWMYWIMPHFTRNYIQTGTGGFPPVRWFAMLANNAKKFANSGWFVQSSLEERVSIPILYSSYWKWGGTHLTRQPITQLMPPSNKVSVKDPATVGEAVLRKSDLRDGLLTRAALRRLLKPPTDTDERRPVPWEERTAGYADSSSYDETGSEAEESETEFEEEGDIKTTIRSLCRGLQREQSKRRELNRFFQSLLKYGKRGKPLPPPEGGPPQPPPKYE
nr:ORF1 [Torque teno felis virus]